MFLLEHFIISFVILSKPGAFLVFKYLILSLIPSIVIFLFRESIGLVLSGSGKLCFVKLQFFRNGFLYCLSELFYDGKI